MRHDWVRDRGRRHIEAGDCGLLGMVVLGQDMENGLEKAGRSFGVGIGPVGRIAVGAGEESKVAGGSEESRSSCLVLGGKGLVVGVESIVVGEAGIVDVGEEERNSVVAEEEDLRGSRRRSNLGLTYRLWFCGVDELTMLEIKGWMEGLRLLSSEEKRRGRVLLILGRSQRHSLLYFLDANVRSD